MSVERRLLGLAQRAADGVLDPVVDHRLEFEYAATSIPHSTRS